jgi:hypothetical protein
MSGTIVSAWSESIPSPFSQMRLADSFSKCSATAQMAAHENK